MAGPPFRPQGRLPSAPLLCPQGRFPSARLLWPQARFPSAPKLLRMVVMDPITMTLITYRPTRELPRVWQETQDQQIMRDGMRLRVSRRKKSTEGSKMCTVLVPV